jgi:hypothetical protein
VWTSAELRVVVSRQLVALATHTRTNARCCRLAWARDRTICRYEPGAQLTQTQTQFGTMGFQPPEFMETIRATKANPMQADCFGLGLVVHIVLTRRHPFDAC